MEELKPYWYEAYNFILSQLENQKKIKYNTSHLIKGIVRETFKNQFQDKYNKNDDLRLSDIIQGDIKGKRTYLSKIMQDKRMFGVLLNRQDDRCPACTLGSFCDRSYIASFLLLNPNALFVGYQKPNPEFMDCHGELFVAKIREWRAGGRTAAQLKLSKSLEKDKIVT
ncbi:MAG: hypothetical protein V1906_02530 [Candidatus Woesearchaeota archaeon]